MSFTVATSVATMEENSIPPTPPSQKKFIYLLLFFLYFFTETERKIRHGTKDK